MLAPVARSISLNRFSFILDSFNFNFHSIWTEVIRCSPSYAAFSPAMFASSQKIDPFKKIDIILTQTCCVLIQLHRGAICPGDNTVLGQF